MLKVFLLRLVLVMFSTTHECGMVMPSVTRMTKLKRVIVGRLNTIVHQEYSVVFIHIELIFHTTFLPFL